MPNVLVVIPFYKRQDQLDRCLAALAQSTHAAETFVHDNTTHNLGFTAACNLGLRQAMERKFTYALLLNQDCYVQPDAIADLVAFMERTPDCAIAGPKQISAEDPDRIIHGGCIAAYPAGQHITGYVSRGDCTTSLPMPWVNGACQMVRVEALYDTGLMDEGFFLIASDSDICFTARARGWQVWYCAEATVRHETGGVSSGGQSLESLIHFTADQVHFRDKWIGSLQWELLKDGTMNPAHAAAALAEGNRALSQKQTIQAEYVARRVLEATPDSIEARLLLGRAYLAGGAPALAVREFRAVLEQAPDSAETTRQLGDALILCNYAGEAIVRYEKALALGVADLSIRNNLGVAYLRTGRRDDAVRQWQEALRIAPNDATAQKNLQDIGAAVP